jgi:hypothetical protein
MMRLASSLTCVVCVALSIFAAPAWCEGPRAVDAEWLAKGNSEGAAIVAKYQALFVRLDETQELTVGNENPRGIRTMTTRSVRLGDNTMLEEGTTYRDPAKQRSLTLECDNADYHFSLGKTSPSSPFALTLYAPGERKLPLWKRAGGLPGEAYYHLKDAIEALAPDNRANLRAVRFDPKAGLLSIEHERPGSKPRVKEHVIIDPEKTWAITRRQAETPHAVISTDYTYGTVIDGLHYPNGSTSSTTPKPGSPLKPMRFVVRVLDIKRTEKSPEDFRLSAFGMPEPTGAAPPPKPTPWYPWMLAAAGACGALALGFAYLRRRLKVRRSANPLHKDGP